MAKEKDTAEIRLKHRIPCATIKRQCRVSTPDAGVIDAHVNAAKASEGLLESAANSVRVRHINSLGEDLLTTPLESRRLVGERLGRTDPENEISPGFGKCRGQRRTQSATSTRHQHDATR